MNTKKILLFLIILIVVVGCGNSQKKESEKSLKNYFFQPEWFKEPKIYVNEVTMDNNSKHYVYRYFEKIGENKLKHIIYDNDFNKTMIITYEYLPDKVIFEEIKTVEQWNNNNEAMEILTENVVFDYTELNIEFKFTHTFRTEANSNLTKHVSRTLTKTDKQRFNGKEVNVVIADGKTKVVLEKNKSYPEGMTLITSEKLIYAENIGVIYVEFENQYNSGTSKLIEIISKDEFEGIKNAP